MTLDYQLKTLRYLAVITCISLTLLALPALAPDLISPENWVVDIGAESQFAARLMPMVINLAALVLLLYSLEHTVGFGYRFSEEVGELWENLPKQGRLGVRIVSVLLIPLNIHALVNFLFQIGVSESGAETVNGYIETFVPHALLHLPVSWINLGFTVVLAALLFRMTRDGGESGLVPIPAAAVTHHVTSSFDYAPGSKEYKLKRKAERNIEKGRLVKAAGMFEKLGREYYYRAGKLYHKCGREGDAHRAFKSAGEYYKMRGNCVRAGDAYFFGGHWELSADAYKQFTFPKHVMGEREVLLDWIRRWGEALFRLGRYMEAAELYTEHELHKLAGESFDKAGRPMEAAKAYSQAGAFEQSIKTLTESGHHELAQMEKAKLHMMRDEFLDAAREFEKGKFFIQAAEAYERAAIQSKAARCYLLAGRPETAVGMFLASGEEFQALNCYEVMEDFEKAAQLAAHMGLQDKQAYYYEKGGFWIAAARAYLMIYESDQAFQCLAKVDITSETIAAECAHLLTLLYQQDRLKEALSCAYSLLEGKKATRVLAPMIVVLGKIHQKLANREKAYGFFRQVADLVPENKDYVGLAHRAASKLGKEYHPKGQKPAKKQVQQPEAPKPAPPVATKAPPPLKPKPKPPPHHKPRNPIKGDDITLTIDEQSIYDLTDEGSLNRYEVIREIGRGGMGYVYKARDKKLKRFVALKMLHPEMNNEPRVVLFFKREAISIAQLNHPNIISLHDLGKERGCFYMVMEYLRGQTLKDYIKKNPAVLRKHVFPVWMQVCEGLRYAHKNGILHRDIKPTNIMITRDRRLKILDFGLAKAVTDLNHTQQLWGTPSFMAPEMFQGGRAGYTTDIYGLGATFYMVTTRRKPFTDATMGAKFSGRGLPEPPHKVDPRIPPELSEIILRCMMLNPEERYQSVEDLMHALKKAKDSMS